MGPRLVDEMEPHIWRIAEPPRIAHDALEDRNFVIARARNDLQDLPRRSLAFQRILKCGVRPPCL